MRTIIIATVSALFFAGVVAELHFRIWPDNTLALYVLCAISFLLVSLLNVRLAAPSSAPVGGRGKSSQKPARKRPARKPENNNRPSGGKTPAKTSVNTEGERETGSIKWFNRTKGFGFIVRPTGEEIFVHHRSIREGSDPTRRANLRDGQSVSYVVANHDKGLQAEDVVAES